MRLLANNMIKKDSFRSGSFDDFLFFMRDFHLQFFSAKPSFVRNYSATTDWLITLRSKFFCSYKKIKIIVRAELTLLTNQIS